MRKTTVILIDDIDGSNADRTIQFGLNGSLYEIDLSAANARQLESALAPFIDKATKVTGHRGAGDTRRSAASRNLSRNVRDWAKSRGITVSDRGRVPNEIVDQYKASQQH